MNRLSLSSRSGIFDTGDMPTAIRIGSPRVSSSRWTPAMPLSRARLSWL